jgi:hypothetical protein
MTVVTENPLRDDERLNDMSAAKLRASTILRAFHEAEAELVGKAVVLSDGKAGTVEIVSLDEDHGLRIFHRGPCRELAHFNNQIRAKLGEAWRQTLSNERPAAGADHSFLNPRIHQITVSIPEFRSAADATDTGLLFSPSGVALGHGIGRKLRVQPTAVSCWNPEKTSP